MRESDWWETRTRLDKFPMCSTRDASRHVKRVHLGPAATFSKARVAMSHDMASSSIRSPLGSHVNITSTTLLCSKHGLSDNSLENYGDICLSSVSQKTPREGSVPRITTNLPCLSGESRKLSTRTQGRIAIFPVYTTHFQSG